MSPTAIIRRARIARVVAEWARELGYEPVLFDALDRSGAPIYHTNVLMCIGERFAVVGTGAIARGGSRARARRGCATSGREIIEIGHEEIERFAGNMLELASWDEALGDCRVRRDVRHGARARSRRGLRAPERLHGQRARRADSDHRDSSAAAACAA